MVDFLVAIFELFGNLILFLDDFQIIGSLTLLRLFIIIAIFNITLRFLFPKREG